MRNSDGMRSPRVLIIICVTLLAVASVPLLSSGRSRTTATSVNIVNNTSGRTVVHVYLSHVNADDWSGNQLGDANIGPGQSYNLTNIACDQQQVKVIGEDQDGCFSSTVATCGASGTWTITNDTARDCGGD